MRIICGIYKGKKLVCPDNTLRPTSAFLRACVFNICQLTIQDASFLDLFAGGGWMGFEALSRKAASVTFVEKDLFALESIAQNQLHLKTEQRVLKMDVFDALSLLTKEEKVFDIIYADPPYGQGLSNLVLKYVDTYPLLKQGGELFLEDTACEEIALNRLVLKSVRKKGKTFLKHFLAP